MYKENNIIYYCVGNECKQSLTLVKKIEDFRYIHMRDKNFLHEIFFVKPKVNL